MHVAIQPSGKAGRGNTFSLSNLLLLIVPSKEKKNPNTSNGKKLQTLLRKKTPNTINGKKTQMLLRKKTPDTINGKKNPKHY